MKKKRWAQAFEESYKYNNYKNLLKINGKFPEYLNLDIEDSIVIECDQREWQSLLFYTYIVKWRKKDKKTSPHFSVKHVIKYLKKSKKVKLNSDMTYMKNIEKYKNRNGLAEVIYEFFKGLEKKHFVNEKRPKTGPAYYRWFTRLTKKEELNEIEYEDFKEYNFKRINDNNNFPVEELFGDISEVENFQVKVKRKKRSSNNEDAEKKEKLVNLLTEKFGYCIKCGNYTNQWRSFTPPDTCECYCNFEKEKEEAIKAKEMRDKLNNIQSDK